MPTIKTPGAIVTGASGVPATSPANTWSVGSVAGGIEIHKITVRATIDGKHTTLDLDNVSEINGEPVERFVFFKKMNDEVKRQFKDTLTVRPGVNYQDEYERIKEETKDWPRWMRNAALREGLGLQPKHKVARKRGKNRPLSEQLAERKAEREKRRNGTSKLQPTIDEKA